MERDRERFDVTVNFALPDAARDIRAAVFVEEQGFPSAAEFDDADASAVHFVALECGKPVGVCRATERGDGEWLIGRIAVVKECRGRGVGAALVSAAEEFVSLRGGRSAVIHAQTRARGFYERIGYSVFGEPDEEEGVPHIWMKTIF